MEKLKYLINELKFFKKTNYININYDSKKKILLNIKNNAAIKKFFKVYAYKKPSFIKKNMNWTEENAEYFFKKSAIIFCDLYYDIDVLIFVKDDIKIWNDRLFALEKILKILLTFSS